jgi:hypothetical protein
MMRSCGRLVDWLSRIADGFSRRSAAGKPVRMDVARGAGDQVIYLIDIIATYFVIPEKKGRAAAIMQCRCKEIPLSKNGLATLYPLPG